MAERFVFHVMPVTEKKGRKMRIAVLIPSRNRPRQLSAAITALHEMESGENEVKYLVGIDSDDVKTREGMKNNEVAHILTMPNGIITIGNIWNFLAGYAKKDADIYSCMIDDAFPISPHWDVEMCKMAQRFPYFSWYEVSATQNPGYPTCTKEYLNKVGYITPEHFPYWFMDSWMAELSQFITNEPIPVSQRLALYSKQENTQNFRHLSWWWGFWNSTRIIRLREAHNIVLQHADQVTFEEFKRSRQHWIDTGNSRDREFRGERIAELENARAVTTEPSQKYLLAKAKAEQYLIDNNLQLWCGLDNGNN